MTVPPPTPKSPLKAPAAVPIVASLTYRASTAGDTSAGYVRSPLLDPFLARPERCAVLTDVDGTLAPIAERPEDARVPPETTEVLERLAPRFALVACVTGRRALRAREMVGADLVYVGNQGFELLLPGAEEAALDPAARPRGDRVAEFAAGLDWDRLGALGLRLEDKGPVQVVHWRGALDDAAAERAAAELADAARERELIPLWGRKVLELRPVAGIDKGSAVHRLLVERAPLDAALFAGDDRTDLDAFRALRSLAGGPRLGAAVRIGVASEESPPEITSEADLVVEGTEGVLDILRALEN
jgi:trehalose 6-phosphate phosphatase